MKSLGTHPHPVDRAPTSARWLAASVADGSKRNNQKTFLYILSCSYLDVDAYKFPMFSQDFQCLSQLPYYLFSFLL